MYQKLTKNKLTKGTRRNIHLDGFPIILLLCLLSFTLFSQAPAFIPWQAIARDATGLAKTNSPVTVEFRIFNTITDATPAYRETHQVTTNDFGYFNLRIGAGTVVNGSFGSVLWQTGDVSYEVWTDFGSGLLQLGVRSGFLSVPYALYAKAAPAPTVNINPPHAITNTTTGIYNIEIAQPSLALNGYSLSLSNSNSVQLPGNFSAGNGIAINGNVISNALPDQTVNLSGAAVSGTYPSYTISQTPGTTLTAGNHVVLNGSAPAYTIHAVTPSLSTLGNATISGAWPSPTINVAAQILSQSGNTVGLSGGGGSVTIQQTSLSAGNNIIVTGSAPGYTVSSVTPSLTATGNMTVSGSYPSQTLNVQPQQLSVNGQTLNLSQSGGTVALPIPTITGGNNVAITTNSGTAQFTISAVSQALSISGNTLFLSDGGGNVQLPMTSLSAGNNISLTGTAPAYTVSSPTPTFNTSGNVNVSGTWPNPNISVPGQTLSLSGSSLSLSGGGGTVNLGSSGWAVNGNSGTSPPSDFLGTTDAAALVFKTANLERMRITPSGSVGIGVSIPTANFDVNYGTIKLGAGSYPFSYFLHGAISVTITAVFGTTTYNFPLAGALTGDTFIMNLNNHSATLGTIQLYSAEISSNGIVTLTVNSSNALSQPVTLNLSYLLLRP